MGSTNSGVSLFVFNITSVKVYAGLPLLMQSLALIVCRETQRDGKESIEEESPLSRASGDTSAQTRSQEVRRHDEEK